MDNLPISIGWIYLVGGVVGLLTVLLAKSFSWKNYEFLTSEEDKRREVLMTPLRRWILAGICSGFVIYGATQVQRDHDWKPFHSAQRYDGHNDR